MDQAEIEELALQLEKALTGSAVARDEPLARHTTFRIGGPVPLFVTADDWADLKTVVRLCREGRVLWKVIGGGSNLLFSDDGFPGVIVKLGRGFGELALVRSGGKGRAQSGITLRKAGAGLSLARLVERTAEQALTGAEFLWGIPGTVGGAVVSNAGAFGHDISELLVSVEAVTQEGRRVTWSADELSFAYRSARLPNDGVITSVVLQLKSVDPSLIHRQLSELRRRRLKTQPRGASAGCVFRNPAGDVAGRMIERAGMKGVRKGNAVVSARHANFIINAGGATCVDVLELLELIKLRVEEQSGVILQEELEVVGRFRSKTNADLTGPGTKGVIRGTEEN